MRKLARAHSGALMGVDAVVVEVEVDMSLGLPYFNVVGLPEGAVKESKVRVISALRNAGFDLPQKRITVNLAPADIRKEGAAFELPIALAALEAGGVLDSHTLRPVAVRRRALARRCREANPRSAAAGHRRS